MKKVLQRTIQVVSLTLFVFLLISGKIQVWMVIFVASALLALLFSRFYCGWLCPINTILRPMSHLKKKLKIKSLKTPAFFKNGVFRIIMLLAFLAVMVVVFRTGKKLPVLPALVLVGVLLSLFFRRQE